MAAVKSDLSHSENMMSRDCMLVTVTLSKLMRASPSLKTKPPFVKPNNKGNGCTKNNIVWPHCYNDPTYIRWYSTVMVKSSCADQVGTNGKSLFYRTGSLDGCHQQWSSDRMQV